MSSQEYKAMARLKAKQESWRKRYKSPMLLVFNAHSKYPKEIEKALTFDNERLEQEVAFGFLRKVSDEVLNHVLNDPNFPFIVKKFHHISESFARNPKLSDKTALKYIEFLFNPDSHIGKADLNTHLISFSHCIYEIKDKSVLERLTDYPELYVYLIANNFLSKSQRIKIINASLLLYANKAFQCDEFAQILHTMVDFMEDRQVSDLLQADFKLAKILVEGEVLKDSILVALWQHYKKRIASRIVRNRALPSSIVAQAWDFFRKKKLSNNPNEIYILETFTSLENVSPEILSQVWEKSGRNFSTMEHCLDNPNCSADLAAEMLVHCCKQGKIGLSYSTNRHFFNLLGQSRLEQIVNGFSAAGFLSME